MLIASIPTVLPPCSTPTSRADGDGRRHGDAGDVPERPAHPGPIP